MSCSVYVYAIWGFPIEVKDVFRKEKRFDPKTGEPSIKQIPDGEEVLLNGTSIHKSNRIYDECDKVLGLTIHEKGCESGEFILGERVHKTSDLMYMDDDHSFTAHDLEIPEKVKTLAEELQLTPELYIVPSVFA